MRNEWLGQFPSTKDGDARRRGANLCLSIALREKDALGVCFSENSDLLSQWRGYADDGSGFSITFDRAELAKFAEGHTGNKIGLSKVTYGRIEFEGFNDVIRKLHETFSDDSRKYAEANGYGSLKLDFGKHGEKHQKYAEAARALFTVKNPAFSEEQEWRLFSFGSLDSMNGVKIRSTGKSLSPYIPITIPKKAVLRVTVGPTNHTREYILKHALEVNGFDSVRVTTSKATYLNK